MIILIQDVTHLMKLLYDVYDCVSDNGIPQEICPYVTGIPTKGKTQIQAYGKRACKS